MLIIRSPKTHFELIRCSYNPSGRLLHRPRLLLQEVNCIIGASSLKNMAKANFLILSLLLVALWIPMSHCAKKPVTVARREDIPYIKCQVCEKVASQLHWQVENKQAQISPKKISEYQIIEISENICNLKKEESDWILKIDIVEKGDKLELVDQDIEGICNSECKTIERACHEVIDNSDTDVAEYIYTAKPQVNALFNFLCKDLTGACLGKPPPIPKDRTPGEAFMPKPAKEAEMEKIMRSMEGMPGAPGMKMYSRDELMNMNNFGEDGEDDDEDEDDNPFTANLGNVLREKEEKNDWKHKVTEGIKSTKDLLRKHTNKVSNRVRQWWKGMRQTGSKNSKQTGKSEL